MVTSAGVEGDGSRSLALARSTFPMCPDLLSDLELYIPDLEELGPSGTLDRLQGVLGILKEPFEPRELLELVTSPLMESLRGLNRKFAESCLDQLILGIPQDLGENRLPFRLQHLLRKLLCQMSMPFSDTLFHERLAATHAVIEGLIDSLAAEKPVSRLLLAGSLASPYRRAWHPVLSDIDLFPVLERIPTADESKRIREVYREASDPPALYCNMGAKQGIGPLRRDPLLSMCIIGHELSQDEEKYMASVTADARVVWSRHG